MAVPDYQSLMRPILDILSGGETRTIAELRDELAVRLDLSEDDLTRMLPSGKMPVFRNRVYWAKFYLDKAGALETVARGKTRINPRGRELLASEPRHITVRHLERYPEFVEWYGRKAVAAETVVTPANAESEAVGATLSPEEALASSYRELKSAIEDELIEEIRQIEPLRFEQLVVELLEKLGYGGAGGVGRHLGHSGMRAWMVSSTKINSAWSVSTCRRSDG